MMTWAQLGFQDSNSPTMNEFIYFNDFVMTIVVFILWLVGTMLMFMSFNRFVDKSVYEAQWVEWVWTLLPAIVLIEIALPSLQLLYSIDEFKELVYFNNIKVVGHQWYWTYGTSSFSSEESKMVFLSMNSYMIPESSLESWGSRLLDVDNYLLLPYGKPISFTVTSEDVLHSLAVPSLGVKMDACPGRLNQITLMGQRPGLFFGQCSEICGTNHSFMPIVLEFVSESEVLEWMVEVWPSM